MQFLTMQQEVAAQLGLDNTVSNQNTLIKRWINTSQQMIGQAFDWPFLRSSTSLIIKTVPDYTTGTATVAANGTAVTISAPIADSKLGQYIQFASDNNWYKITEHTAGNATLTIDPSSINANTSAVFTIRKFYYGTSSSVDRILSIREVITPYDLGEISAENFYLWTPFSDDVGSPRLFYMLGKDSSDIWQFGLWPIPDTVINLYVEYIQAVTDLSSDTSNSIIPAKWHTSVLLKGAIWQGLNFLGDTRATVARDEFYEGVEEMKRQNQPSRRTHRVMLPVDSWTPGPISNLPGNYPPFLASVF